MIPRKAAISLSSIAVVLMLASGALATEEVELQKLERHCNQVHAAVVQGMLDSAPRETLVELSCGTAYYRQHHPFSPATAACNRAVHALGVLFKRRPESEIVPPDVCKN